MVNYLEAYSKTLTTPYDGLTFDKIAVEVMGKTQIAQLRKMANFTFTRHKSINLPEDRLAKIEAYMRKRAVRLLALTRTRSAKKKEDKEER